MSVTAWSYSRLSKYEECPAAFKYEFIDKLVSYDDPRKHNAATKRGDDIHKAAQAFLTDTGDASALFEAKRINDFQGVFEQLKANQPLVEQEWGFDQRMRPTGWFGRDTWYRMKLDVGVLWPDNSFTAVDWKTGKPWGTNQEQMEQFAWGIFSRYPQVHSLETRLMYLDQGQEQHGEFTRKDQAGLDAKWRERAAVMFADKTHAPRPSGGCKRCIFSKSAGGPCAFS